MEFLRKILGRKPFAQNVAEDADIEQFFTDSEHARQIFDQLVSAAHLPKPLLIIHGVGGAGKSTLLKMYRLSCRRHHIPIALISGEDTSSAQNVLENWANDLGDDKITLSSFQGTLTHYHSIQAKVETEVKKSSQAKAQFTAKMGKAATKTLIEMAASNIPIVGPLLAAIGGVGAEAFVDWLRGFLPKADMELYLNPTQHLTDDFLSDLTRVARHQRIVLMIDTYEQMMAIDDWVCNLTRRLPKNVLLIIAGRAVPEWERAWQGWLGRVEIVELKEMVPDDVRMLVRRYYYYSHIRGEPDPRQVEAIVQFARGLPIVATTVVRLWIRYNVEDFQAVRPRVVADLVDRLLEGVPQEMRRAFEVAAVLRYFNADALKALLDNEDAEGLYEELQQWPFVRTRKEGLSVHSVMREMINEALHMRAPERFRTLHERAAEYYEMQLIGFIETRGLLFEGWERLAIERVYHVKSADRKRGYQVAQEYVRLTHLIYRMDLFQQFLGEMAQDEMEDQLGLSILYERARFLLASYNLQQAERSFLQIIERFNIDIQMKKDVLNSLSTVTYFQGKWKESLQYCLRSLSILKDLKQNSAYVLVLIGRVYFSQGLLSRAEDEYNEALNLLKELDIEDKLTESRIYHRLGKIRFAEKRYYDALKWCSESFDILQQVDASRDVIMVLLDKSSALSALGDSEGGIEFAAEALRIAQNIQDKRGMGMARSFFGDININNGRLDVALDYYKNSRALFVVVEDKYSMAWIDIRLCFVLEALNTLEELPIFHREAEGLAKKYEYYDHLALIFLFRAYISWKGLISEWGNSFDTTLGYYQQSLVCALHYNRFLLDDVLTGRALPLPLPPIIPYCLERGEEGRHMLAALSEWWQTGTNNISSWWQDATLSVSDSTSLLEAERVARERELGNKGLQQTVIEQIKEALI